MTDTWLAIETTDDGEILHGISLDLAELETRVLTLITAQVIEENESEEEQERITDLVEAHISRIGMDDENARARLSHGASVRVIGAERTNAIYRKIQKRFARVAFSVT